MFALIGKPGAGKSYLALLKILEELENGTRNIVTNLPLNLEEIVKYFISIDKEVDVYGRVTLLDDSRGIDKQQALKSDAPTIPQVRSFWRYRGAGFVADPVTESEYKQGKRPDYSSFPDTPVFYVLDEVHEHFSARAWQDLGAVTDFYLMKHRHLGDEVIWVSQSAKNVDSHLRTPCQSFFYCRNWGKESFKGFRKGNGFTATEYLEPFTGSQLPQTEVKYKIDPKKACCYNTSLANKEADTKHKRKGIHVYWLFGGFVLALFALFYVVSYGFPRFIAASFGGKIKKTNEVETKQTQTQQTQTQPTLQIHQPENQQKQKEISLAVINNLSPSAADIAKKLRVPFSTSEQTQKTLLAGDKKILAALIKASVVTASPLIVKRSFLGSQTNSAGVVSLIYDDDTQGGFYPGYWVGRGVSDWTVVAVDKSSKRVTLERAGQTKFIEPKEEKEVSPSVTLVTPVPKDIKPEEPE